ncbi:hypothetical protein EXIGLDRAFT_771801 [Exidia glandulosa HHB12029]|uniref:Uncharacterized protein n=1 Tax=Exidia glandulosa HHB12029 TaxID=1314781 RepID=A0A165FQC8_EXIGL|nr:hypothetical protein EXIGLDRAFT_771801 [Exidia glandulosa HHB12029]
MQSVYSSTSAGPHGGVYVASDLTLEYDLQQLLYRQHIINQRQREAAGYPPSDSLLFSGNPTTSSFPLTPQPLVLYAQGFVTFAAVQAVRNGTVALSDIIPRDRPDILSYTGWRQLESLCLELAAAAQQYYGYYSEHTRELYSLADDLSATVAHVESIQGVASPDSFYLRTPRASDYQLPPLPREAFYDPLYLHPTIYEEQLHRLG